MAEDFRRDATEHMYLEDIKKRDIDNISLIQKNLKDVYFDSLEEARIYHWETIYKCLSHLGVNQEKPFTEIHGSFNKTKAANKLKSEMRDKDVTVDPKIRKGQDMWRSGMYIYHHNEIAYWISFPIKIKGGKTPGGVILPESTIRYLVRTNYKF